MENESGVVSPPTDELEAGAASASPDGDAEQEDATEPGSILASLLWPVSITMTLVVLLVVEMKSADQQLASSFSQLMVYQEDSNDSTATLVGGVVLNGLVLVAMLAAVTTFLLALYKFRCYIVIYAWLLLSVSTLLGAYGGYIAEQLMRMHDVPCDQYSFFFVLYNFAVVGTLLVFWIEFGCGPSPPLQAQQAYLVMISSFLAWSATKTPEWSTWGLLGAVAIWDLIAVLTPSGPLKLLVEEAERRNEPIPGLVYQSSYNIKLGLGDFVFYSVLVGRASMHGAAPLWVCAIAVLAGLCATLALLPFLQKVLPALPISIAIGIGFYFVSSLATTPMAHAAAVAGVVL